MKWFGAGSILFSRYKNLKLVRCIILFIPFILFAIFSLVCFILFFIEYLFYFPVEASGFSTDSRIKDEDDKYQKISKIVFGVLIFPCIFACKLVSVFIYIVICPFALWTDALRILFTDDNDKFVLSKYLLQN